MAFACDTSGNMKILAGKIDNSTLEILTSESGVLRYEEVSGETVNPFTFDADTLGGSTKEQIISEAQSGLDLSNIDAATLEGHAANYFATASDMNSCFQSVSSGKTQVANAITGKGVSASGNDTFATLASKIGQIDSIDVVETKYLDTANEFYFALEAQSCSDIGYSDESENVAQLVSGGNINTSSGSFTLPNVYTYGHSIGNNPMGEIYVGRYNSNTSPPVIPWFTISSIEPTAKGLSTIKNQSTLKINRVNDTRRNVTTIVSASYAKSTKTLSVTIRFNKYYDYSSGKVYDVTNTSQNHVFSLVLSDEVYVAMCTDDTMQEASSVLTFNASDLNIGTQVNNS